MLKEFAVCLLMSVVLCSHSNKPVYTKVTFLYDIKRGELSLSKRTYQYYLSYFEQLLRTDVNLIVFGNKQLEEFVWRRREQHNTVFVHKELSQFQNYWFSNLIEKARQGILQQPKFYQQNFPQYAIKQYNLLMFGKLNVMTEAIKYDKWNTDYLLWTDGGFMHHFSNSIIYPQNIVKKFYQILQPQWVYLTYNVDVFFGYKERQLKYINRKIQDDENVFASTMGGTIHIVKDIKNAFQNVARITLENGDLCSDESIFTLLPVKYPFLIPTTESMQLGYNRFHVYGDDSKNSLNPRYFRARIDLGGKRKMLITLDIQKVKNEQNIKQAYTTSLSVIRHGFQAQERAFKSLSSFKKNADQLMIKRKLTFVALLWIVILILFVQNRKMKKELTQAMVHN